MTANGAGGMACAALLLAASLAGCRAHGGGGQQWTFALSRAAGDSFFADAGNVPCGGADVHQGGGIEQLWLVAFCLAPIVLPLAVDVVLLPVAVPHDLVRL